MTDATDADHFFAVVPDGSDKPAALFRELDEAIEWGLARCGAEQFSIRGFVSGAPTDAPGPSSVDVAQDEPSPASPVGPGALLN